MRVRHKHRTHGKHAGKHEHHAHKPAPKQQLGASPTNAQKLIYVANKLGLPGIAGMQGSTVNLFDTIPLTTSTSNQTFAFFTGANGKGTNVSNFQNQSLRAGEAMIIERVAFFLVSTNSADLSNNATTISDVIPIAELSDLVSGVGQGNGQIQFPGALKTAQCKILIANQTVVKSFMLFEQMPQFNPLTTGISDGIVSVAALPALTQGTKGQNVIPLEAPPVLPPNQSLEIDFTFGEVGTVTNPSGLFWNVMCVAGRFGSIFASKQTL
jgi:hypothetical protein